MKIVVIPFIASLLMSHALSAQQQSKDTPPPQYIQTSGSTVTFQNAPGSGTITLEYLFTTGISAPTITVQGCGSGGTCTTLTAVTGTNPYTTATNAMATFAGGYFQYKVTATYTGTGTITAAFVGIQAKAGSGGGDGPTTFDQIGSGTNTGHGLVVGSGSVLTTASGGFINANELNGVILSGLASGPLCNTTGTGVPTICSSLLTDTRLRMFGQCSGGVGFASAYSTPATAAPAPGCVDATGNPVGYLSYLAAQPAAQFTTDTFIAPANFTGADIFFTFYTTAVTGNVALTVASGCLALGASPATVTYGTPQTVTTPVSATPSVLISTASLTNIAQAGVNSCAAGSQVVYKVSRLITDTAAAPALLVSGILAIRRSS